MSPTISYVAARPWWLEPGVITNIVLLAVLTVALLWFLKTNREGEG